VGAEYIIEEKATGQQLGSAWFQWSKESQLEMVNQIIAVEAKLASVSLPQYGSIYYKSDLESRGVAYVPIDSDALQLNSPPIDEKSSPLEAFVIGPSTDPNLWAGETTTMDRFKRLYQTNRNK
jgi:hypothetical protein